MHKVEISILEQEIVQNLSQNLIFLGCIVEEHYSLEMVMANRIRDKC